MAVCLVTVWSTATKLTAVYKENAVISHFNGILEFVPKCHNLAVFCSKLPPFSSGLELTAAKY